MLLIVLMILALILNIWLIPIYGMVGAAMATGALAVIYNVAKFVMILVFFKMQPYDFSSLKILTVILVSFGIANLLPQTDSAIVSMIVKTIVISTTYLGLSYFMKIAPEFHKHLPFHK